MHIGLGMNTFDEALGDQPSACVICAGTVTLEDISGLAVDDRYQIIGNICPVCLSLDVDSIRATLRARGEEALARGQVVKPSAEALEQAKQNSLGWAHYVDGRDLGHALIVTWVYFAWFGPPVDASDDEYRATRTCNPDIVSWSDLPARAEKSGSENWASALAA